MRDNRFVAACSIAASVTAMSTVAGAQDGSASVRVSGMADVYYGYNSNRPADGASFIPGTGTSAKRHDEFSLNLANIDVAVDAAPVGLRLVLAAGTGTEVVHAGEPVGVAVGPDVWRIVQQASVTYRTQPEGGVIFEGGIYPCHVGMEVLPSKDNWNYTRSWLGELSPYYVSGVKVSGGWNGGWSAQLHLINGWQNIAETNHSKAIGTQIAYASDRLSASFNTLIGRERTAAHSMRLFGDLVAVYRATDALSLGASIDLASENLPGEDATWNGIAGYLRYAMNDRWAVAFRAERFDDEDGAISGVAQTLSEGTGTLEFRPDAHLILRLEGRADHSDEPVFGSHDSGVGEEDQFLVVFGAVAVF